MSDKIETRTLIIRPTDNVLITPIEAGRLTFDHDIDIDRESSQLYEAVERAAAESSRDLPPIITRRHLGEIGTTNAFVASTFLNRRLSRDFTKRPRDLDMIERGIEANPEAYDNTDVEIFQRYLKFRANEV